MRQDRTIAAALIPDAGDKEPLYELIELLFFAYRDFVGDPDRFDHLGAGRGDRPTRGRATVRLGVRGPRPRLAESEGPGRLSG